MKPLQFLIFLFLILLNTHSFSQELPPLQKYSAEDYGADNQNWMLSQAPNNFIYVANSRGLLEFNGSKWHLYTSPNNTVMRAVSAIGKRIYTGCFADFGYWEHNEFGTLEYQSLIPNLEETIGKDEQVWNILDYNEWVLFQTNDHIYFYNTSTKIFKTIDSENLIYKAFKLNNRIYFHVANEGLYRIDSGQPNLIINGDLVENGRIINIFEIDNKLAVLTRNKGFYVFENGKLQEWSIEADEILKQTTIYTSLQLEDESYILGTIANGLIHITKEGKIDYQFTQKEGLSNNTVLSLWEDNLQNLWAGLDNGIDCININSAFRTLVDYEGGLGTVYSSQVFKDYLYIGTNQGLFYKKYDHPNDIYKFIKGTEGQVWSLYNHNNETLFCGHHLGTFIIEKDNAKHISTILGTWDFKKIPSNNDLLLQGNYNGLHVLQKTLGHWSVRNKIEGFDYSSRYFTLNSKNEAWVNHEYKGLFKLSIDDQFAQIKQVYKEENLSLGNSSSLVSYNSDVLYASDNGVFIYDSQNNKFIRDSILSSIYIGNNYVTGKLIVDEKERLWAFTKDNIVYISKDDIANKVKINTISIPTYLRKGPMGYENIALLSGDEYLLGTANGYITMDLSKVSYSEEYFIYLNTITLQKSHDGSKIINISLDSELDYHRGIITFDYSVPEYDKFLDVKYQYKLQGLSDKYSSWSSQSSTSFENLSFANYTFNVRAKIGNELTENTITYKFKVNRPWHLSNLALLMYLLLLGLIIYITNKASKRYYRKKIEHGQLENEQIIMRIKNENLRQDVDSKNRELAISTMSIIKKNEVLHSIKKELKKNIGIGENKAAIKLIDENMNNTTDWEFFEKAFNNANQDFLEKIKLEHPELTPNDLRFCAYLRLNLSSKEIAPLLNISTKSVETKRYRLRKRLNLDHDDGLVDYILKF